MIFVICPYGVRERDGVRGNERLGMGMGMGWRKFEREL